MMINEIIYEEEQRNQAMIDMYSNILSSLPKGVLIKKKCGYYYLKYREGNKVIDKYIGNKTETVNKIARQIEERKHNEKMLKELIKEKKKIYKIKSDLDKND